MGNVSSTRRQLINLLYEHQNEHISGQYLADQLNISRNAIWKHMNELENSGFTIDARPRVGYQVRNVAKTMNEHTLQWGLKTKWLGQRIIYKQSIPSTQTLAHELAQEGTDHGTVVIAQEQTESVGRMNRPWHSARNKGIWLSMILRPSIPPYLAPQLTLFTATVLADLIAQKTNLQPKIKWPNDLLINEKKVSGILTEMQAEQDQALYVIIGIGLNVNQTNEDLPEGKDYAATSLYKETNKQWHINQLTRDLLHVFEKNYEIYLGEGFKNFKQKWESYGFKIGEKIRIETMNNTWDSLFHGIAEDGALIVDDPNKLGEKKRLYSGEIKWFKTEE